MLRSVKDDTKAKFDVLLRSALSKGATNKMKSSQHLIEDSNINANESSEDEVASTESSESEIACAKNVQMKAEMNQVFKNCSEDSNTTFTKRRGEGDILSDSKNFLLKRFLNANASREYEVDNSRNNEVLLIRKPPVPKPRQSKIRSISLSSNNTNTRIQKQEKIMRNYSPTSFSSGRTYDITKSMLIEDILIHKSPRKSISCKTLEKEENSKIVRSSLNQIDNERNKSKEDNSIYKDVIEFEPIGTESEPKISYNEKDAVSKNKNISTNENEILKNTESLISALNQKLEAIEMQSTSSHIRYENEIKPKPMKRTKIKKQEESSLVKNKYKYEKIISITVHRTDKLKLNSFIIHPVVKVHIVNAETGEYIKKTDKNRGAVFYLESSNVNYLLPVITRNFNLQENRCLYAEWEETIIINEDFEYIIDPKSNVVIFFELLDFITFSAASLQPSDTSQGWHKIAWAFLKIVAKNNALNIGKKLQLQLYRPGKLVKEIASKSEVFHWWQEKKLVFYPSILYVTVKGTDSSEAEVQTFRSKTPLQNEQGSTISHENFNFSESKISTNCNTAKTKDCADDLPYFKYKYEVFKLPNKLLTQLDSEEEGCFVLKFSHSGLLLACSVLINKMYTIVLYSVPDFDDFYQLPSHQELIYNICWSQDDSFLLSSSADGTISIWDLRKSTFLQMLPHPSFVYWCEIANSNNTIATCCYDNILRVWMPNTDDEKLEYILHDELEGHKGYVTCVCFGYQSNLMFSSDSVGSIIEWKIDNTKNWNLAREIKIPELKSVVINQIILHKKGKRLIVHARDSIIRIVDVKVECIIHWLEGAHNRVRTFCCVTPCFSYVLSGSENGILLVWNLNKGQLIATYHPYDNFSRKDLPIHCVDYNPKQNMLAFSHYEHDIPIQVYVSEDNEKSDVDLRIIADDIVQIAHCTQLENVRKQKRTKGISIKNDNKINLQNILEKIDKIIG